MFKPQPFRGCDDVKKERKNARQLHRQRQRVDTVSEEVWKIWLHTEKLMVIIMTFLCFVFKI